MSGKAYTMKEMKGIVDYLAENKYYNEIRGRKMWMDYANTSLTVRTWQSLKETFLKRVLPDIYNPYYKLSKEQIVSFKEGYDVEGKGRNKLEIQTISDDSNSEREPQKDSEIPTTSNINPGETTDENKKCSKISYENRSSTDTLVLENCYENAEEIQKVLESSISPNQIEKKQRRPIKKFKDFITYSEPLAPILQEVINDFASESEYSDREPAMEIDESALDTHNEVNINQKHETPIEQENKVDEPTNVTKKSKDITTNIIDKVIVNENEDPEIEQVKAINCKTVKIFQNDILTKEVSVDDVEKTSEELLKVNENTDDHCQSNETDSFKAKDSLAHATSEIDNKNNSVNKKNETQNCSNTADSLLPNNPEGFEMNKSTEIENTIDIENTKDVDNSGIKYSRKRAISEDNVILENKKKKVETKEAENVNISMRNKASRNNCVENIVEILDELTPDVTEFNLLEPATSKVSINEKKDSTQVKTLDKEINDSKSLQIENIHLKSVNLFEDQSNKTKLTDSDSSVVQLTPKQVKPKIKLANIRTMPHEKDVVLLKSHSESENHEVPKAKKSNIVSRIAKSQRDKALANVFGFSTGAVASSRKKKLNRNGSTSHHMTVNTVGSGSSEWTSESDSEVYVSPPRGRRNKQMKYLKPKSSRIVSLEEEGGLFVMYGKRIYPLVKDGKIVKNYLTYLPNNDSDFEEETFWKLKYEKEKKKSEELKQLLERTKEPSVSRDRTSPKKQSNCNGQEITENPQPLATTPRLENNNINKEENDAHIVARREEKIKIKFTRNNEEVHLEGHWPQIHPVLEQVVNIFHKDTETKINETKSKTLLNAPNPKEINSGQSTPVIVTVDPEVREKVDTIEKEIFQEIEERDKEEQTKLDEQDLNVTKRNLRRSRRISAASVQSSAMGTKSAKQNDAAKMDESIVDTRVPQTLFETENIPDKSENDTNVKQTRIRRKTKDASFELEENKTMQTRKSTLKREESANANNGDDEIRYMLPPAKRGSSNRSVNSRNVQKTSGSLTKSADITSPDSLSRVSESTQGYNESDISPIQVKKKKNLSTIVRRTTRHDHRNILRRSQRKINITNPYDSNNSSYSQSMNNQSKQSSNEIYNSESYQCLFPRRIQSSKRLERIDEIDAVQNDIRLRHFEAVSSEEHSLNTKNQANDVGSSSSVSLPQSPELSVVENISVNKDLLNSIDRHHTINEFQTINGDPIYAKYMISDVDVAMPLMQQTCKVQRNVAEEIILDRSLNKKSKTPVSESLLNKIRTVKIYDNSSDSIDRKLQDLLLESTKKDKNVQNMDIDNCTEVKTKKSRAKKRCSTPRKKKEPKKPKTSKVGAILEEHIESCSYGGRASCPPSIQVFDENAMDYEEIIPNNKINVKGRQKKDIIKVKIIRPKLNKAKDKYETVLQNHDMMSVCTDSVINDAEMVMFFPDFDKSVELIHNHSETCLHAKDCIEDSVELIETSDTIISINSNSMRSDDWHEFVIDEFLDIENASQKTQLNNNLQNFQLFNNQIQSHSNIQNGSEINQGPGDREVNSSLITEDWSDEMPTQTQLLNQPTKWFLLSEDEISNTNMLCSQVTRMGSGSNLKQIFPIACAIPDLSDITEASRENDDSKKPSMDVDSQSFFSI